MTGKTQEDKRLGEIARLNKLYGNKAGSLGSTEFDYDVVPTGSLALDYALGTGGWPLGRIVHIFGQPDIGKSSTLGLSALRNAQAKDMNTGIIAVEPGFDPHWAIQHGVDPKKLIIARPNNGEEAFHILREWVYGDAVDFTIVDSIGAIITASEAEQEGKARVGGASKLITEGLRRILMMNWKMEKGLLLLNQVRDDLKSQYGGVKPPGGWLLEHVCDIWVHLRNTSGSDSIVRTKDEHGDEVIVGRNLTAHVTRNKLTEGTGHKAKFWYYNKNTSNQTVGIDEVSDLIATATRTGVFKASGHWYSHPLFDKQLNGKPAVLEFCIANPTVVPKIREQVLEVMRSKRKLIRPNQAPSLKVVDGS